MGMDSGLKGNRLKRRLSPIGKLSPISKKKNTKRGETHEIVETQADLQSSPLTKSKSDVRRGVEALLTKSKSPRWSRSKPEARTSRKRNFFRGLRYVFDQQNKTRRNGLKEAQVVW
jgi:hypothetical protein